MKIVLSLLTLFLYIQSFTVINIENTDTIVCEDATGNIWAFYADDINDYEKGDQISAVMYNNGTDSIYDDSFIIVTKGN